MKRKGTRFDTIKNQLLVIVQTMLCVLVILAALVLKAVGGNIYSDISSLYKDTLNNSVFTDGKEDFIPPKDNTELKETSNISPPDDNQEAIIENIKAMFHLPLSQGTLTSPFGKRTINGIEKYHKGMDIGANKGENIYTILDGNVIIAEKDESYGNYVVISHSNNVQTLYAHCDKLCVKCGDNVKKGQTIALVGSTGDSDGNHLHLEILIGGINIDPARIMGEAYQ